MKKQSHLEVTRALRKRSLDQYKIARGFSDTLGLVMPKLEQGVQQIRSAATLDKAVLPGIEKALVEMDGYLRALKEAHALELQALNQVEAGVGHLQEATTDLPAYVNEEANLATLMQYHDVAVRHSEEFWLEALDLVDAPVFAAAWNKTKPRRQGELASKISETREPS